MRILVVSQSFYPDNFKINDIIQEFSDSGHEVTVLSGLGDYTTGKVHPNYRNFKNRTEEYNGCKVVRVRTISRRTGPIYRSLNYLSFLFFGSIWAFFTMAKFDIVYVYQPSPATMIYPGIVKAKKDHIPLLIYCLDIWPEAVKAMNIKEETFLFRCIAKISRYAYNKADSILVSSQSFMDYLHNVNGIPKGKMSYLPQHADKDERTVANQDMFQIKKAKANFVFTGNIGFVQDVETIIEAASMIERKDEFKIHIVGDGSNYERCVELAKKLEVTNQVIFYGRMPQNTMSIFYEMADACLLTLKYENKIGLTIPAKLQGYMAAGKPIIAAINGDGKKIIEDANCGLTVEASNSKELAKAIETFMDYSTDCIELMGKNSFNYFEKHFNKDRFVKETLDQMESMVKKGEEIQ